MGIFLFDTLPRPAQGPTEPPIERVSGALPMGMKRPGREADHSPPSSAKSRIRGALPALSHTSSCHGAQLKHGETLLFIYV